MDKSDLKDGMIVEYKNGKRRLFINNILLDTNNYNNLDNYREDLTNEFIDDHDIVKIFEFKEGALEDVLYKFKLKLIWERKEMDWKNVPFGTRVRVWDDEEEYEGKFLEYYKEDDYDKSPYMVYITGSNDFWWKNCELIEEPAEEVTYEEIYSNNREYCRKYTTTDVCVNCKYNKYEDCTIEYILQNYNMTRKDNK